MMKGRAVVLDPVGCNQGILATKRDLEAERGSRSSVLASVRFEQGGGTQADLWRQG